MPPSNRSLLQVLTLCSAIGLASASCDDDSADGTPTGGSAAGAAGATGGSGGDGASAGDGGTAGAGSGVWEPELRVSANGRFLEQSDGTPFFWLGDTAWPIFHRLTLDEADAYFADRQAKGFTVIQAVVTGPGAIDGVHELSHSIATGELPFVDADPTQPNEAFFAHVDAILESAAEHHLLVGLLPTWAEYVCPAWQNGPTIFDTVNAEAYGRWLGARYRDQVNILWIMGGDRAGDECGDGDLDIWTAFAEGIKAEDPNHLMTYHPKGNTSSVTWFHDEDWLDFNMYESHLNAHRIVGLTSEAYAAQPPKPVVNGEPCYYPNDAISQRQHRSQIYWTMLAGGAGHTFGQSHVWQLFKGDDNFNDFIGPIDPNVHYTDYLDTAGTSWVMLCRHLFQSLDWTALAPAPGIILSGAGSGLDQKVAAQSADGQTLVMYFATASQAELDLTQLSTGEVDVRWWNPTDGSEQAEGTLPTTSPQSFEPPAGWDDGVLLLTAAN